ncbi:MAG: M48 family metallopeptidase [Candidatus Riflebacteria bacterium]|nr:M48 family metallopeptidase [Candidatus Riflebacteria bacterium]
MKRLFSAVQVKEEGALLKFFEESFNLKIINGLIEFKEKESPDNYLPFYMRGYSLPINKAFGGKVYSVCSKISEMLGYTEKEIEFYVSNEAEFNSSSILSSIRGKPHIVIINRGLIEKVSLAELEFIIGHEIGHLIFRHAYVTRVIQYVYPTYENLPPLLQKLYDVWSKLCEISADRVGLLACGDLETAVRGLFKLSSALDEKYFDLSLENMVRIADLTYTEMREHPSYVSATHPANPIRIKALMEFSRSTLWDGIVNGDKKAFPHDPLLEEKMNDILYLIKKAPFDEQEEVELMFLASAGMLLLSAQEEHKDDEYNYLINVLAQYVHWPPAYLDELNKNNIYEMMEKASATIMEFYPQRTRDLVKQLFPIIVRDRKLADAEVGVFLKISTEELKIPYSEIVDIFLQGIRELYQPFG